MRGYHSAMILDERTPVILQIRCYWELHLPVCINVLIDGEIHCCLDMNFIYVQQTLKLLATMLASEFPVIQLELHGLHDYTYHSTPKIVVTGTVQEWQKIAREIITCVMSYLDLEYAYYCDMRKEEGSPIIPRKEFYRNAIRYGLTPRSNYDKYSNTST